MQNGAKFSVFSENLIFTFILFLAKMTKYKDETNLVSLKRKKRLLYRQIKELEMEFDMGNVNDSDYQNSRNALKQEVSSVIAQIKSF